MPGGRQQGVGTLGNTVHAKLQAFSWNCFASNTMVDKFKKSAAHLSATFYHYTVNRNYCYCFHSKCFDTFILKKRIALKWFSEFGQNKVKDVV